jgi:hypothetical protein
MSVAPLREARLLGALTTQGRPAPWRCAFRDERCRDRRVGYDLAF